MSETSPISEQDIRDIVRILGEVAAMKPDPDSRRVFLLKELASLLGSDTWIWCVAPMLEVGKQPVFLFHHTGGFDPERLSQYLQALEHPDTGAITAPLPQAIAEGNIQVTRTIQQIAPGDRFVNSPARPLWDKADISQFLFTLHAVEGYGFSGIAFYRSVGSPAFTERESRIAHIILAEVPLLHIAGMPHAESRPIPKLPPRCRLIINHLVHGQSRKTIAAHLGLSEQTVNGYVKKIYAHFGVHSQSELITRFTRGDSMDQASDPTSHPSQPLTSDML